MDRGISDLVIVVIKLRAYEDEVTHPRIKLIERDGSRGEGPNMLTCKTLSLETIALRHEETTLTQRSIVMLSEKRGVEERAIQNPKVK
jgi:hypothetical protein